MRSVAEHQEVASELDVFLALWAEAVWVELFSVFVTLQCNASHNLRH